MQEDDENVEVWYLMAVAFNSLQPPDYESARCVLGMMITAVVIWVVRNVYCIPVQGLRILHTKRWLWFHGSPRH